MRDVEVVKVEVVEVEKRKGEQEQNRMVLARSPSPWKEPWHQLQMAGTPQLSFLYISKGNSTPKIILSKSIK
jgi:hypothetical protein